MSLDPKAFLLEDANQRNLSATESMERFGIAKTLQFRVFLVGWRKLKGVLGDSPVPLLWPEFVRPDYDNPGNRKLRFIFEQGENDFIAKYQSDKPMDARQYRDFFETWSRDLEKLRIDHIIPYIIAEKDMPDKHKDLYDSEAQKK